MKNTIKPNYDELDNYGCLTEPSAGDKLDFDFGKLRDYCREHNKTLSELSEGEIEQFNRNKI